MRRDVGKIEGMHFAIISRIRSVDMYVKVKNRKLWQVETFVGKLYI